MFITALLVVSAEPFFAAPTPTPVVITRTERPGFSNRLRALAGRFGALVCGYAIMSNHLHLVLRNRPDSVSQWSDAEVALRWRKLFPQRDDTSGELAEPDDHDLAMLMANADTLAMLRGRLSSLSWFMRCLCEWVARAANREDGSAGRFWAGRFKSQPLLDESALLAC